MSNSSNLRWAVATPAKTWWASLAARERWLLMVGGLMVLLALLWLLALGPAWRSLQRVPAQLKVQELQLQQMQLLAAEAQQLRALPPISPEQAAALLRAAVQRLGPQAVLSLQTERAVLNFKGLEPSKLGPWLAEVRASARARPIEVNLTRTAEGYAGTLVLALGAPP